MNPLERRERFPKLIAAPWGGKLIIFNASHSLPSMHSLPQCVTQSQYKQRIQMLLFIANSCSGATRDSDLRDLAYANTFPYCHCHINI